MFTDLLVSPDIHGISLPPEGDFRNPWIAASGETQQSKQQIEEQEGVGGAGLSRTAFDSFQTEARTVIDRYQ
jgi:hypothetical protein